MKKQKKYRVSSSKTIKSKWTVQSNLCCSSFDFPLPWQAKPWHVLCEYGNGSVICKDKHSNVSNDELHFNLSSDQIRIDVHFSPFSPQIINPFTITSKNDNSIKTFHMQLMFCRSTNSKINSREKQKKHWAIEKNYRHKSIWYIQNKQPTENERANELQFPQTNTHTARGIV